MLPPVVSAPTACLVSLVRSRLSLCGENLALRHQLAVYKQTIARPRLRPTDRLLWAWLSRWWSGWQEDLAFVQPRTVLAWQRKRFRDHWRRLSQQGKSGQPVLVKEVRELMRTMWQANPTWGSPRIVGELRKLGIIVAKSTVEKYRPKIASRPRQRGRRSCTTTSKTSCHATFSSSQLPHAGCSSCSSCWLTSADASCISTSPNTRRHSGPRNRWSRRFRGARHPGICCVTAMASMG